MIDEMVVKIGDRIVGKKTGTLTPSTVVGIMTAHYYINAFKANSNYNKWNELYPNWVNEFVVTSLFDEPQYSLRVDELEEQFRNNEKSYLNTVLNKAKFSKEQEKAIIEAELEYMPKVWTVAYPIEDVEVI